MSESDDHYKTLELPPGASVAEVKAAYRELAKVWHPDRYPYDSSFRSRCEARMRKINEAYLYLRKFAPQVAQARPGGVPEAGPAAEQAAEPEPPPTTWGYRSEDYDEGPRPRRRPQPQPEPPPREEPSVELSTWVDESPPPPKPSWAPFRKHIPLDAPDLAGVYQVGAGFSASILVLASYFVSDFAFRENYYEVLRLVVSTSCLYGAYFSISREYYDNTLWLSLLAASVNPVIPVPMPLEEWRIVIFLLPFALVYFLIDLFDRESRKG